MTDSLSITIIGGGVAGLAAGYYARKKGLAFTLYEAEEQFGGNCRTLCNGQFFFDTGSHRFHDMDHEITKQVRSLLGSDLKEVRASSRIYYNGRFIDFPLSPMNLFMNLGPRTSVRAALEIIGGKIKKAADVTSFESFALDKYGCTIAESLLLNYSKKLWGRPCTELSPAIAGNRMNGLNFGTLIRELVPGTATKTCHLEGSFFYPVNGIFMIPERLAESAGIENIRTCSRITRLFHEGSRIKAIRINDSEYIDTEHLISTIPLNTLVKNLEPSAPPEILQQARRLSYRSLIQVAVFLNKNRISSNASIYFPDAAFPFTRIYEPKNRSYLMAPPGLTSLVAEIPCSPNDEIWTEDDISIARRVQTFYERLGWIHSRDLIDTAVERLPYAYPVLTNESEEAVAAIISYLKRFSNLRLTGRNGLFRYVHIHDMLRFGMECVEAVVNQRHWP